MIIISLVYLNELLENNIPSNQNDLKRRIDSVRGKNLDYEKRKKKNLVHPSISRQEQRMNRGIIQGARSILIPWETFLKDSTTDSKNSTNGRPSRIYLKFSWRCCTCYSRKLRSVCKRIVGKCWKFSRGLPAGSRRWPLSRWNFYVGHVYVDAFANTRVWR